MELIFEKFIERNKRLDHRITLTKSYSIGLPAKFYSDNRIEQYKYAILYWDSKNFAIGIEFSNKEEEVGKFKIVRTQKYGGSISCRSFLKRYDIDPKRYAGRYEWERHPNNGAELFVILLKEKNP